jgi:hypothetical protein
MSRHATQHQFRVFRDGERGLQQTVLAAEVVIDEGHIDLGATSDSSHGGPLETEIGE